LAAIYRQLAVFGMGGQSTSGVAGCQGQDRSATHETFPIIPSIGRPRDAHDPLWCLPNARRPEETEAESRAGLVLREQPSPSSPSTNTAGNSALVSADASPTCNGAIPPRPESSRAASSWVSPGAKPHVDLYRLELIANSGA
jgi:hypothetical protein